MRQQDILNEIKSGKLPEENLNSKLKGLLRLFIQTRLLDNIASVTDDLWSDPRGGFLSVKGADSRFQLFGLPG